MTTDNGILARVPGEYIAAGASTLPKAGADQEGELVRLVVVEVPDLGAVRISYRLRSYRHGRSRLWHWLAVRGDVVEG